MNKTSREAKLFVENLASTFASRQAKLKVFIASSFTSIHPLSEWVQKNKVPFTIGAQNIHEADKGAFTGEVSAQMIKEAGASFVIIGHSERRHIFHESDEQINKKIKRALSEDLQVIFCVGELLEERESGQRESVLQRQLEKGLEGVDKEKMKSVMLGYEPVWAIGTGKVATPEDASCAHSFCREWIAKHLGAEVAERMVIQYGGSVNGDNAASLLKVSDVDGLLVGGASLSPETFNQILLQGKEIRG